jgi:hypothetical protein
VIADLKQGIDIASVVESAGVETNRNGMALCPFHNEKTPSFKIYERNGVQRCHCFGCGFDQDVIGFVMAYYNLSFQDALKHLGIEQGRITPKMSAEIEQRKRKTELIKQFKKWCGDYGEWLGTMINRTQKLMKGIAPEDLDLYAALFHALPVWEQHSDVLLNGDDKDKLQLFKEAHKWNKS